MNSGMAESPVKVVLDTNIFVSALVFVGKPEKVYRLVLKRKIITYISLPIITEIIEVLTKKFNFNQIKLQQIERKIKKFFIVVNPSKVIDKVRDPDDNRVLEAAVEGNCDFIITGDKDLLDLGKFKKIKILTAEEFLLAIQP